jgi:hypothetical protein
LWLRIAAKYPIGLVNEVLARYRIHQTNTSREKSEFSNYEKRIAVVASVMTTFPNIYMPHLQQAVYHHCIACSKKLFLNGHAEEARDLVLREINQSSKIKAICYWLIMLFKKTW